MLRYVHKEGDFYVVKESFVGFKEQHREITGEAIAGTILDITTELQCWKHKFVHYEPDKLPYGPIDALNQCDTTLFTNIPALLKILGTIPVTSCEAEQTFSALRQIKPFLRTTMTEERLSGLTLLHIRTLKHFNRLK